MKKKHIMITGAGGFIGNYFVNYFSKKKYYVHAYYHSKIIKIKNKNIIYIKKDLRFLKNIDKRVSIIIHAAALTPPTHKQTNCFKVNNEINFAMIKIIKKFKINKFLFLSSVSVYGIKKVKFLFEGTKINKQDLYGKSKFIMEKELKKVQIKNLQILILRLPTIIGFGSHSTFLSRLGEEIKKKNSLKIYNPNSYFNSLIHISNLSKIILKLLSFNLTNYDILNISSNNPVKMKSIFNLFKKKLNPYAKFIFMKKKTNVYLINSEKIKNFYGIKISKVKKNLNLFIKDLS